MAFSIIQKELAAPSLDQLKRAYRALPTLRDLDAQTSANDAYGILLKGLEEPDAVRLHDALAEEGVATEVINETDLPVVPPSKVIHAVEFSPAALILVDPLGRSSSLVWNELFLLVAGDVRVQEFKKVKNTLGEPLYHGSGITYDTTDEARSKEESHFHWHADIVLAGGVSRYTIPVEQFNFEYLKARFHEDRVVNLGYLFQDLVQFAAHAGLNRGAYALCDQETPPVRYPSKAAYFEELTWMLWRSQQR